MCKLTDSRHPDELYINGIQRESFIPAIDLIKERFDIVDLNSGTGACYVRRPDLRSASCSSCNYADTQTTARCPGQSHTSTTTR